MAPNDIGPTDFEPRITAQEAALVAASDLNAAADAFEPADAAASKSAAKTAIDVAEKAIKDIEDWLKDPTPITSMAGRTPPAVDALLTSSSQTQSSDALTPPRRQKPRKGKCIS